MLGGTIMNKNNDNDTFKASPIPMHVLGQNSNISMQETGVTEYADFANEQNFQSSNIFDEYARQQNTDINDVEEEEDIYRASPIPMHVVRRNRKIENQNTTIPENNNNQIQIPSINNISSNEKKHEMINNKNIEPENSQTEVIQTPVNNVIKKPMMPMTAPIAPSYVPEPQASINNDIKEKRKNKNKWQIVLFVIASILLIGALVLAILSALGFFKKKDNALQVDDKTRGNTHNVDDDNININENNNVINNNNNNIPNIETSTNIDGRYDSGILYNNNGYSSATTISGSAWDGISKSDGLLTNGDINYTERFQEIVNCENSPNVTYTLWKDLNGDGVCQVNEILAKGKGFMVDGNCAIINGRKFPLTNNMQAYSNLNKLSNQELKVLNHTSTYWKDGTPHVILDGIKTSVNVDMDHVGGVLNIEGYKIGDFSTTNISRNTFAKDVIDSYLNNNNLTDNQKKLISAWATGRSSSNVKQLMEYHEMENGQSNQNLKDTHKGQGQEI